MDNVHRHLIIALLLISVSGCGGSDGPAIEISDVQIFAPLPGSSSGVAYMTIRNNSGDAVAVQSARSPQFARVEMHQTVIEDGVSKMRPLGTVAVPPGEAVHFEQGGRHFMLMGAESETGPGSPVTIEISHTNGLLIVSATMQARLPAE